MVYLPTVTIKSTIHVGKHISPMDPMGTARSVTLAVSGELSHGEW